MERIERSPILYIYLPMLSANVVDLAALNNSSTSCTKIAIKPSLRRPWSRFQVKGATQTVASHIRQWKSSSRRVAGLPVLLRSKLLASQISGSSMLLNETCLPSVTIVRMISRWTRSWPSSLPLLSLSGRISVKLNDLSDLTSGHGAREVLRGEKLPDMKSHS